MIANTDLCQGSFTLEYLCQWLCECITDWLFALAAAHVILKNSQGTEQARSFYSAKLALSSWHSSAHGCQQDIQSRIY
ncbi:hypothetical protein BKA91DRAFT_32686 [Yarrowia lipolytica]|nr:hypothetical protein BKA91DRAFT_32686 [Yarrowia lipolytica]